MQHVNAKVAYKFEYLLEEHPRSLPGLSLFGLSLCKFDESEFYCRMRRLLSLHQDVEQNFRHESLSFHPA